MTQPAFTEADADRAAVINSHIDDDIVTRAELAELSGLALKLRDHLRAGGELPSLHRHVGWPEEPLPPGWVYCPKGCGRPIAEDSLPDTRHRCY